MYFSPRAGFNFLPCFQFYILVHKATMLLWWLKHLCFIFLQRKMEKREVVEWGFSFRQRTKKFCCAISRDNRDLFSGLAIGYRVTTHSQIPEGSPGFTI